MKTITITSAQNPRIKELQSLAGKSKARSDAGLFVVEGQRELGHCLAAGFVPETVFVCRDVASSFSGNSAVEGKNGLEELVTAAARLNPDLSLIELPAFLYEKVAYRGTTEGIMAVTRSRSLALGDLQLPDNPLVLVLESVEKPGNLGAVLRSADAAGADAVIVCDPLTDIWNPNLIRSSVGAVFTVPVAVCTSAQAIDFLKARSIRIFTAQLQDSSLYYDADFTRPAALVMGTEATGLSWQWREAADSHIRLPMLGSVDSLNVSVSASILLYEALRQRTAISGKASGRADI